LPLLPRKRIQYGVCYIGKIGKPVPITGPRCPEGSRKLRLPDYKTMTQDGGRVVSLSPRKYSWYSFLLEAESTPGP